MKKEHIYLVQGIVSTVSAAVSSKLGILYPMLIVFTIMMIVDFISGMAASAKEAIEHPEDPDKGWSSKKGLLGVLKKFSYILVIGVAIGIDIVLLKAGAYLGVDIHAKTFFGLLVTIWFILNEFLSILENAGRMGAEGVIPKFLLQAIATLKQKVSDKGEDGGKEE